MDRFWLKILALTSMTIDHMGYLFFPEAEWMRIIGRLAFPIFCFFIAEGCTYTSNIARYAKRLLTAALLSELPFDLMIYGTISLNSQNVMFTLLIGVLCIWCIQKLQRGTWWISGIVLLSGAFLTELLRTDYGAYGICLIIGFYLLRKNKAAALGSLIGLTVLFWSFHGIPLLQEFAVSQMQLTSVAACIPLALYQGEKGISSGKYWFYAFYPVHMLLLYVISLV